jgi:hypothetical protein
LKKSARFFFGLMKRGLPLGGKQTKAHAVNKPAGKRK